MALIVGTNSFISVADADTYFLDNLQNDQWTALTTDKKSQALITAGGQINPLLKPECQFVVAAIDIPADLANANAELGLYLVENPTAITAGNTGSNTKQVKAGSASVTFFRATSGSRFSSNVMTLLNASGCVDDGAGNGLLTAGGAAYGTDGSSNFSNDNAWERSRGYP